MAGQQISNDNAEKSLGWIQEELDELRQAMIDGDKVAQLDAICDLYWVVTNAAFFSGQPPKEVSKFLSKVSRSNWSKFCTTEAQAKQTVQAYANGEHPDKLGKTIDTYYERVDSLWVVKATKDNKVMKSLYYKPVSTL